MMHILNTYLLRFGILLCLTFPFPWLPSIYTQSECDDLHQLNIQLHELMGQNVTAAFQLADSINLSTYSERMPCKLIWADIWLSIAFLHYQRTDYQKAYTISKEVISQVSDDPDLLLEHLFYAFWANHKPLDFDRELVNYGKRKDWILAFHEWSPDGKNWRAVESHFDNSSEIVSDLPLRLQMEYFTWRAQNLMYSTSNKELQEAKVLLQNGLRQAIDHGDRIHEIWIRYQLGFWGRQIGNNKIYEEQFKKVLQLNDQLQLWPKTHPFRVRILNALALASETNGDLSTALALIDETIDYHNRSNNPARVQRRKLNKAKILTRMGNLDSSLAIYLEILPGLRLLDLNETVHIALNNVGDIFRLMGNYEQAIKAHNESLALKIQDVGYVHDYTATSYLNIGRVHYESGNILEALNAYQSSYDILEALQKTHGTLLSSYYRNMAELKIYEKEFDQALELYQKAANALVFDDQAVNFSEMSAYISAPLNFIEIQMDIAGLEPHLEQISKKQADSIFQFCINYLETIRLEFDNPEAKSELQNAATSIYNQAISFYLQSPVLDSRLARVDQYFALFEKAKSYDLRSHLNAATIQQSLGLPDSLFQLEKDLKNQIHAIKNLFVQSSELERDSLGQSLSDLVIQNNHLQSTLRSTYPVYYSEMYDNQVISASEVQAKLEDDQVFLNFHLLDSVLLCIKVDPYQQRLFSWTLPLHFEEKVTSVLAQISDPRSPPSEILQELAKPHFSWMAELCTTIAAGSRITILPSGVLTSFPFELLLLDFDFNHQNPRQIPYLISQYDVNYAYSAQSGLTVTEAKKNPSYFGMAPMCCVESAKPVEELLEFTDDEIFAAAEHWQSTVVTGQLATKMTFQQKAKKSDILHLATHGYIDHETPLYNSRLSFFKSDTTIDGDLYIHELYGLDLNSNLAVLSACNSGIGTYNTGNGVVSLARGFKFAGCNNIVQSLWSVDDQTTAQLIDQFFKNCRDGQQIGRSLSQAKRQMLASIPAEQSHLFHPFYWSGLILYGSNDFIYSKSMFHPFRVGLIFSTGILIIVILSIVLKKKLSR